MYLAAAPGECSSAFGVVKYDTLVSAGRVALCANVNWGMRAVLAFAQKQQHAGLDRTTPHALDRGGSELFGNHDEVAVDVKAVVALALHRRVHHLDRPAWSDPHPQTQRGGASGTTRDRK